MRLKTFITLIEIECKKMLPWLLGVIVLVTGASLWAFRSVINQLNHDVVSRLSGGETVADIIQTNGYITMANVVEHWNADIAGVIFFFGALALALVHLILWEKEWTGQSKRIYMLLSLKGSRFMIFWSKLLTSILGILIYVGSLLINFSITGIMLRQMLPNGLVRGNMIQSALGNLGFIFTLLLPTDLMGIMHRILFVILMFSMVAVFSLLRHSFRIKGFIAGILYFALMIFIFVRTQMMWLFYDERPLVDFGFVIAGILVSVSISYFLINKKISV